MPSEPDDNLWAAIADPSRRRVLEDLCTPARVLAGVEPLAEAKTEGLEHPDHPREEPARAAKVWWSWFAHPSPSPSCRAFCTWAARLRDCQ